MITAEEAKAQSEKFTAPDVAFIQEQVTNLIRNRVSCQSIKNTSGEFIYTFDSKTKRHLQRNPKSPMIGQLKEWFEKNDLDVTFRAGEIKFCPGYRVTPGSLGHIVQMDRDHRLQANLISLLSDPSLVFENVDREIQSMAKQGQHLAVVYTHQMILKDGERSQHAPLPPLYQDPISKQIITEFTSRGFTCSPSLNNQRIEISW
jgi:hypothetical protein